MKGPSAYPLTATLTWLGLLGITLINTLIAFLNLGPWNTVIAVGLTIVMAMLIVAFWMHALHQSKVVWMVIAGAILWFLILITGTLNDYVSRGWGFPGK